MLFLVCVLRLSLIILKSQEKMNDAKKNSGFLKVFKYFCIGKRNLSCYCVMFLRYEDLFSTVAEKRTLLFVVPYCRDNETDNSAGNCQQHNIILKNPEEYSHIR